jgi:hypothetical protein
VGIHLMVNGADEADLVGELCEAGEDLADVEAGIFVGMVLRGPRYSLGAIGLGSQLSSWLGPPHIQKRITEVGLVALPDCSRAARRSGRVRPPKAKAPARKNSLREPGPVHPEGIIDFALIHRQFTRSKDSLTLGRDFTSRYRINWQCRINQR